MTSHIVARLLAWRKERKAELDLGPGACGEFDFEKAAKRISLQCHFSNHFVNKIQWVRKRIQMKAFSPYNQTLLTGV